MRRTTTLGLTLLALFAFEAAIASSASATEPGSFSYPAKRLR
jgi:hypothetical protein